jgi:hypothetical protein
MSGSWQRSGSHGPKTDWSRLPGDYARLGTYEAVAAEYGVSRSAVAQHVRAHPDITPHQGGYPGKDWPGLRELYLGKQMTIAELAAHYGTSGSAVQRQLHKQQVPVRPRGIPHGSRAPWNTAEAVAERAAARRRERQVQDAPGPSQDA